MRATRGEIVDTEEDGRQRKKSKKVAEHDETCGGDGVSIQQVTKRKKVISETSSQEATTAVVPRLQPAPGILYFFYLLLVKCANISLHD